MKVLPKYVKLVSKTNNKNFTELRLEKDEKQYWRDAGHWGVDYRIIKGKLYSWCKIKGFEYLHKCRLVQITKKQYNLANEGYL